jgi:hypothetical protein
MNTNKTSIKNKTQPSCLGAIMRSFSMDTVLDFGKHRGKTIKQLFDADEDSYVMWLFENIDGNWSSEIERELECRQAESNQIGRNFMWGFD